jgi:uncharacterized protein
VKKPPLKSFSRKMLLKPSENPDRIESNLSVNLRENQMAKLLSHACGRLLRLAFFVFFFLGSAHAAQHPASTMRIDGNLDFVRPDGTQAVSIAIEIADTVAARTLGLMGRELPDFSEGMLFVFERNQVLSFWMRNTPAPLDIIFVSENGEILNIAHRTIPMSDILYSSAGAARYVVEVRGGFCEQFGIDQGARIQWRRK